MSRHEGEQEVAFSVAKDAANALELLFASHAISKKRLYWENFVRGVFLGLGSVVGAAIVISIVLWVLSITQNIPFIGPISQNIEQSIQNQKTTTQKN